MRVDHVASPVALHSTLSNTPTAAHGAPLATPDVFEQTEEALYEKLDEAAIDLSRSVREILFSMADAVSKRAERLLRQGAQQLRYALTLAHQLAVIFAGVARDWLNDFFMRMRS